MCISKKKGLWYVNHSFFSVKTINKTLYFKMTTLKPSVQHVCKQIIENNSNLTKQYKNQTNLSSCLSFCLCTYFINRLELWWSINVFYYVIESSWTHLIFIEKISYNMMKFSINPFSDIVWSNHDNSSVMKWQWPLTTRFSCTKGNLELHGQVMYYNVDVRLALIIAFCKYSSW
jgi:hypothetical protein